MSKLKIRDFRDDRKVVNAQKRREAMLKQINNSGLAQVKRKVKPKFKEVGQYIQPHVFGCSVGHHKASKVVRRFGSVEAMKLHPELEKAEVRQVPVKVLQRIDYSKYKPVRA